MASSGGTEYRRAAEQDLDVLVCILLAKNGFRVEPSIFAADAPPLHANQVCKFVRACILNPAGLFMVVSKDTQLVAFAYGTVSDSPAAATVAMAWANACHRECGIALVESLRTRLVAQAPPVAPSPSPTHMHGCTHE